MGKPLINEVNHAKTPRKEETEPQQKAKMSNLDYNQDHIPEHSRKGLMAMNAMRPLADIDPDVIPNRLLAGESVKDIASSYGLHQNAVYAWLLRNCPDIWQEIKTAQSLSKLDECEEVFDKPISEDKYQRDGVETARTREKAKVAQWNAERANRKLFGDKLSVDGSINLAVTRIERVIVDEGGVIEHESEAVDNSA